MILTILLFKLHPRLPMLYLYLFIASSMGSVMLIHETEGCSVLTYRFVINKS